MEKEFLVVHDGGWAEIEKAHSAEQARRQFISGCRNACICQNELEAFNRGIKTITVKDMSKERSEYCVCGVHESEHLLCGCGEWERAG